MPATHTTAETSLISGECALNRPPRNSRLKVTIFKTLFIDVFIHHIFIKHLLSVSILLGLEDTKIMARGTVLEGIKSVGWVGWVT